MSNYQNIIAAKNQTIKALGLAVIVPSMLAVVMGVGWMTAPTRITLHYPPDLSSGAKMNVAEIPKANIYLFSFYIFQQLNRWETNGEDDYYRKIHILKNYLTASCFQDRLDDYGYKKSRNELAGRERSVREIPGRMFENKRVVKTSYSSWIVSMDLHVVETLQGEKIKERFINYPINIVRFNVDPENNPWGLAIDCLASTPRIIEIEEKKERT